MLLQIIKAIFELTVKLYKLKYFNLNILKQIEAKQQQTKQQNCVLGGQGSSRE